MLIQIKILTFGDQLLLNNIKIKLLNLKPTTFLLNNVQQINLLTKTDNLVLPVQMVKYLILDHSNAQTAKVNKNTFKKHINANNFSKSQTMMLVKIGSLQTEIVNLLTIN